jgi:very-short-patch-repair endonuclease/precorrin-3B methylase
MDISLKALEKLRERLLDLTFRNKLLNFKHNKSCLRVIDELPNQLVETLLSGSKMKFIAVNEPTRSELIEEGYRSIEPGTRKEIIHKKDPTAKQWAEVKGLNTSYQMPDDSENGVDDKHQDKDIQTVLYPFEMESTLKKIYQLANTSLNETGSNILYLSFGFLEWKSDTQDRNATAPLFLMPVTIKKGRLNLEKRVYEYSIEHSGDEIVENLSLKQKLKQDFGLALPILSVKGAPLLDVEGKPLLDAEGNPELSKEDDTPEDYFKKIEKLIQNRPEWSIERFVTLSLLNFTRLLMYLDLDPDNWPAGSGVLDHPIASQLLGGLSAESNEDEYGGSRFDFMDEYEVDTLDDVHDKYPLIFDADSSQHSAIVDVIDGKNLVIEGPPGTGKSQTISNLIGAALGQGKSVLFMSEKLAALNVVYEKLTNAGLGDFCLNLHSHKSQKKEILQSIGKRIGNYQSFVEPLKIHEEIKYYERLKDELSVYANAVNQDWKSSGYTIHEVLNIAARYQELLTAELLSLLSLNVDKIDKIAIKDYERQLNSLLILSKTAIENSNKATSLIEHEWYGFNNSDIQSYEYEKLKALLNSWNSSLEEYSSYESEVIKQFSLLTRSSDFQKLPSEIVEINEIIASSSNVDFDNINSIEIGNLDYLDECLSKFINLTLQKDILLESVSSEAIRFFSPPGKLPSIPNAIISRINHNLSREELNNEVHKLEQVQSNLTDIDSLMEQVRAILNESDLTLTVKGLEALTNIICVLKSISPQQISQRDSLLDREETESLFPDLKVKVTDSRIVKDKIDSLYKTVELPDSDRLEVIAEILKEQSIFRWLRGDYREARKELLGYAKNKYIKLDNLLLELPQVYSYRDSIEGINNGNFNNCFGNYLNGDETDIESIESIVLWFAKIREVFGVGFGKAYKLRDTLKNLQNSSLQQLHTLLVSNHFDAIDDTVLIINTLKDNFKGDFENNDSQLLSENGPILSSLSTAKQALDFIDEILILGDSRLPIAKLIVLYNRISEYLTLSLDWESVDINKVYFKQDGMLDSQHRIDTVKSTLSFFRLAFIDVNNKKLSEFIARDLSKDNLLELEEISVNIEDKFKKSVDIYKEFEKLSDLNIDEWLQGRDREYSSIIKKNSEAEGSLDSLNYWTDYIRKVNNIESKELAKFIQYFSEIGSYENAIPILRSYIFNKLSRDILRSNRVLEDFSSVEHNNKLNEFIHCDNKLKELQKQMILYKADKSSNMVRGVGYGPVGLWTEGSLLDKEVNKKTRHIPIRKLITRASKTLQSLKPCFMMSPMSVSQYLTPGGIVFDLVIMDEASQIRPEDALGTIARGKQVVIVGDPKQLPPSNFFRKNNIDEDEEDEDERSVVEEQESILDAALGLLPLRRLRWHYRSKHQSLIAFSNYSFYDDNLVIFPSPVDDSKTLGIRYSKISKGTFVDRRNIEEARIIALSVRSHMLNNPDETLGVVTMNVQQREQIEREIEILAKDGDKKFADIYEKNLNRSNESFFIKNLENVQGDERDVIYISMTYGPQTIGGKVYKRFGDINKETGWRRLNVLFTRSKRRMHIFSSLDSSDVPNTGSRGVKAFNAFLRYCETGQISRTDTELGRAPDSDFEISVMEMLSLHRFECVPQVGEAGFFIDVAVRDPNKPGRFLMAIECDGATYHSSKSARDRDRLKQQILEGLGWNVKRIWSTDWFRNPRKTLEPIIKELNELKSELYVDEEIFDEECEIDAIVNEQDKTSTFDAIYSDLGASIREKLIKFNDDKIIKEFPDTRDENRLLSSFMMDALVEHQPYDKTEFLELIPEHIREHIDRYESAKYLNDILNIIASSMDSDD